mmetsp:Transcript_14152/g.38312  ORF Transcript_14152/g.38312 Transcript_14152/m.38312 type:complete len:232 (+) Transcript_14152:198-893(+)|eukprot:CAMPEP_0202344654 /NCGR_PEP_ID=MMETSP1126-20121109/4242_1 /ASSEMBLY_ACC=CAM_ASM_000457 /TAXON_ID=3047 /ORGANISM="Dunaliella tertiolecta, Strain CCMP1320" /LENGTH=231 /DNA_ID=CAMNT_0048935873 /DNA_START=95 /DNA_END=790 /DNA_ORIENTATION=-
MALLGPLVVQKVGLSVLLEPKFFAPACGAVGVLYPCHQTIKALEQRGPQQHAAREQWLLYWMSFAALTLAEAIAGPAVTKQRFYPHIKLAFLLWLQLPRSQGARRLYQHVRPALLRRMPKIDHCLDVAQQHMVHAATSFYTTYKTPIDQATHLVLICVDRVVDFVRWWTSEDEGDEDHGSRGSPGLAWPSGVSSEGVPATLPHTQVAEERSSMRRTDSEESYGWVDSSQTT